MSYSTDPIMNAALEADAEKLRALGQDPGPELEDFDFDTGFEHPCPRCNGTGQPTGEFSTCPDCYGEGYLDD